MKEGSQMPRLPCPDTLDGQESALVTLAIGRRLTPPEALYRAKHQLHLKWCLGLLFAWMHFPTLPSFERLE